MDGKIDTEKEQKAISAKLGLLEEMRKLHEWTVFGQKEAEDLEKSEAQIDLEAPGPATDERPA